MVTKSNSLLSGTTHTRNSHSTRSASPIAFFFVAIICFLFGVVSNSIAELDFSSSSPLSTQLLAKTSGTAETESKNETNDWIPLGLQWFKMGYDNPWQFSTMRTGIDQLDQSLTRVLERDGKLPRVVVSFTSLPKRFDKYARETVRILKKQTYLPDRIYIAVPKTLRRSNDTFTIPSWVRADPLITVLRPDVDYGPGTKLIPALEEENKLGYNDTRVVTIDDDNEGHWSEESLLQLVAYSLHFEHAAIGFTGWNVTCMVADARCDPQFSDVPERQFSDRKYNFIRPSDDYACHSLADWLPEYYSNCLGAIRKNYVGIVDVLEGYRGVLYQPRFFDLGTLKTMVDKTTVPEYFLLVDDVWFSGWLSVRKITRLVINPAIHQDAEVRMKMQSYSEKRNLSFALLRPQKDDPQPDDSKETEAGLHDLGEDFVKANHDGVRWFERQNGWTPGLWNEPHSIAFSNDKRLQNSVSNIRK